MYNESLKTFKPLSEFKNRSVKLYRSSDIEHTKKYFTNNENESNPYFEILKFDYEYGKNQLYIKYPNTNYFRDGVADLLMCQ